MSEEKLSLYIFGTGAMASIILPSLRLSKCNITAFVDERPNTWNTEYMSHPVIGLQDMHIDKCDFLLIICRDAKNIASRLVNDYAIPKDKVVTIDIYDKLYKNAEKESIQKSPSEAMRTYLSPFSGFFEIIDMNILENSPIARAWLVPKSHIQSSGKTKYCHNFLHFLNFEPSTIQPCCLSGAAHQIPSEFAYTGGEFDINSYRDYINKCIEEIQTNTYLCDGCPSLIETDKSLSDIYNDKFNFKYIVLDSHRFFCNCKCEYCSLWQPVAIKSPPYSMIKLVKELVENDMVDKDCMFEWGGGEPTILKEFNQTAKWLMSKGYFQRILTSALQISPVVISILEAEKGKVLISLDAGSSNTYKRVKGVEGWEKVKKVCATYCKHSAKDELITLKYIIYNKNNDIAEITNFLNFCEEIGIKHVVCTLEFKEMHARVVSQQTLESSAFFCHKAKQMGLQCQPFSVCEPYQSQLNELITCM